MSVSTVGLQLLVSGQGTLLGASCRPPENPIIGRFDVLCNRVGETPTLLDPGNFGSG